MNLLKLIPILLEVQKKFLNLVYSGQKTKPSEYKPKSSRTFLTANTTLEIKAQSNLKSQKVSENARIILKKYLKEPEKILEFVESKGTKVVKAKNIDKVLTLIGENEGFIGVQKGFKALFLITMINILSPTKLPYSLKTKPMFVLRDLPLNIYTLAHQFHHWIGYSSKLPGYEEDTMEKFKHIWALNSTPGAIEKLSLDDVLSLRDAIQRDVEAIQFVQSFTREHIGSGNALKMIKNAQAVNV